MKQRTIGILMIIGFAAILLPGHSAAQGPAPSRKIIYSLEPGEEILHAESLIALSALTDDIILVLSKTPGGKGPFSVLRDGAKKGPFPALKDVMAAAYQGRNEPTTGKSRDCATYAPAPPPDELQPTRIPAGREGELLEFRGKSAGPFKIILATKITPDGSLLYYTASNNDKSWFGCSDGRQVSFGGIPTEMKFSPDGKNALAFCEGTLSMDQMQAVAKLPPDKIMAAMKEQEKKFLFSIDGRKFGPFGPSFDSNDFWFPAGSNDFYYKTDGQIFRNGTPFLETDSLDPCAFYPSPDGKKYAIFSYDGLTFSDGSKYPSSLDLAAYLEGGQAVFKWIVLENNKDLVVYKRTM